MNILLLNYPYLQNELKEIGHNLTSIGDYDSCDIKTSILSFEVITDLTNQFQFDIIIYSDGLDKHPLVSNFLKFDVPKVYISIDSTINYFWQKHFISCFDIIFVDQLAVYEKLRLVHKNVYPLLLSFNDKIFTKNNSSIIESKIYDITFVGRINENTRIKRSNILNKIKKAGFKLNIIDGFNKSITDQKKLSEIYNQSKIVLNESLFPSINLRLFEVLGSGTLLFNEESDDYIKEYFQDKKHLVYYNHANLIEKLNYYLKNDSERESIAKFGYKTAQKFHTDSNRAKFLIEIINKTIENTKAKSGNNDNLKISFALSALFLNLKWDDTQTSLPAKSLFMQNTEIIYSTIKKISDNSILIFNNHEICNYLKLCYTINEKDKIEKILFNYIDLSNLDSEIDINLIQFIFFYSLENKNANSKFSNLISNIFNLFILEPVKDIKKREIKEQNCLMNEKYYYYYFVEFLGNLNKKIEKINFGFTQTNISPIFFTTFDFYHFCMQNNINFEKSILNMITILIEAKAYDNVYVLYNILYKKYPTNSYYTKELKKYSNLSYLIN